MCLVGCRKMAGRTFLREKNENGRNGWSSFLPFSFLFCTFVGDERQLSLPTPYISYWMNFETKKKNSFKKVW